MNRVILLFILHIFISQFLGCSDNVSGGSAGEVGNPKVAVIVVNTDGAPVESVSVVALEVDFNPLEKVIPASYYTDPLGYVLIDLPDTGKYVVNGRSMLRGCSFISLPVTFSQNVIDTIYDTLKGDGGINIILPDSVKTEGKYFYLAGTPYNKPLTDAIKTMDRLVLTFDSIPDGIIPALILYDTFNPNEEKVVVDTMSIKEGDSNNVDISVISNFITSDYLDENTIGVKGVVVDSFGLRWIACSTAIIYETAPSKWATYILANNSYSGDHIGSILIDNNDVIWFGGNGGIIRHFYDSVGAYWQFWDNSKTHLSNDTILTMGRNLNGDKVWIITPDAITAYRENDTSMVLADTARINMANITCITEAKRNEAWIGTSEGDLVNLLENNDLAIYQLDSSGIDTCSVLSMDEDNDTTLWIVTDKKVISFNNGSWRIINSEVYYNLKVKQVAVNRFDNSVWFLSDAGLCCYKENRSSLIYSQEFVPPLESITFPLNSIEGVGYVGMRKGVVQIK